MAGGRSGPDFGVRPSHESPPIPMYRGSIPGRVTRAWLGSPGEQDSGVARCSLPTVTPAPA